MAILQCRLVALLFFQKPDFMQLQEETPANTCLCTHHENMWLLNSAVEKLPDISGLINRIVYDKNSSNYRKQKCGT